MWPWCQKTLFRCRTAWSRWVCNHCTVHVGAASVVVELGRACRLFLLSRVQAMDGSWVRSICACRVAGVAGAGCTGQSGQCWLTVLVSSRRDDRPILAR